jgi:Cof subfamily protein (haloacid dehalogenase superfamily)
VHARDIAAIRRLRAAGVVVTIATGRTPAGTLHVARNLSLSGPCVCTDGAMVVDMETSEVLRHQTLGSAATTAVAGAIGAFPDVRATVLIGSTVVLDEGGSMLERVARSWSPVLEQTPILLDHACWQSDDGITAGAVIGLADQISTIAERLDDQPLQITHFEVTRYDGISSLIIHPEGVSKGDGLAWLAQHHGCELADTVAVGDWLNDVSMLEAAPRSFAMAHAPERVKSAAKHVLEATRGGGAIAEIAERVWSL